MEAKDLPPFQPGDIIEIITHNTEGDAKSKPLDDPYRVTNATRRRVAIIIGTGTSEKAGYGDYINICEGMIDNYPINGRHKFLKSIDEVKVYPRIKE